MFRDQLRVFLEKECTPASVRARWETETGRSAELWGKLAEMGLLGLRAEERFGGLGMDEVDFVLLFEEAGRVALPEPLLETAAVGVPLLAEIGGDLAGTWLPRVTTMPRCLSVARRGSKHRLTAAAGGPRRFREHGGACRIDIRLS